MVEAIREVTSDEDTITAGYLHDVLEDTSRTVLDLNAKFGPAVTSLVWAVTGVGENRSERMRSIFRKIQEHPLPHKATTVKCCNRLCNMRRCLRDNPRLLKMYRDEHPLFASNLSAYGPRRLWLALDAVVKEANERP